MKIRTSSSIPADVSQFILFCRGAETVEIPDTELNDSILEIMKGEIFTGKAEEILPVIKGEKVCVLVGLGEEPDSISMRKLGELTKSALQTKPLNSQKPIAVIPASAKENTIHVVVDGMKLGLYKWNKYVTKKNGNSDFSESEIVLITEHTDLVMRLSGICDGVNLARDLANENADVADSQFLEDKICEIVGEDPRCSIEILNHIELQEKGLNLHLAVNQGSLKEPKLVIVTYRGAGENDLFTALIGKGITFDSGGLNLKSSGAIENMRMDMCGAAAVIGTLYNTLQLNVQCNAYFVCGLAENAIGSKSYKPGDVLVSYSGKTVEICNTDAEGRLVLADAISYMVDRYQPDTIIDIATLTGAVVHALGYEYTGLMANDEQLAADLLDASKKTDDRAWELPLYAELQDHVKSTIADIKNVGESKCAGTISAGEFLRQFAVWKSETQKWAHLDIAGTSKPKKSIGYFESGATGAGTRLLTQYLLQQANR